MNYHATKVLAFALFSCALALSTRSGLGQSLQPDFKVDKKATEPSPFQGEWAYRSFVSNPDLTAPPNTLLFGSGTLQISVSRSGEVSGSLGGEGWQLALSGTAKAGTPASIRFQGKGIIGGEEWVYDYLGYRVPQWENGIDQRAAIVGSIVRTKTHSGGNSSAGVVAQWIAVKTDPAKSREKVEKNFDKTNNQKTLDQEDLDLLREERIRKSYQEAFPMPDSLGDQSQSNLKSADNKGKVASLKDLFPKRTAQKLTPPEVTSKGGRVDLTLNVAYGVFNIGNDQVRLRSYNNCLAGPTIRMKAGETLYITLNNRLPVEPGTTPFSHGIGSTGHMNGHHDLDITNLHFHGLHVSPGHAPATPGTLPYAVSDNIFVHTIPSDPFDPSVSTQKYKVEIPENHVAGTFWYHAHRHGSTTAQVSSGLAGALIVERDDDQHNLDSVDKIGDCKEEVMLLQQIPYLKPKADEPGFIELEPPVTTVPTDPSNEERMFLPGSFHNLRRYTTVNGQRIPELVMRPGEVRRLRLIHSGQREEMNLSVERDPSSTTGPAFLSLHEIAVDGLPTGGIRTIDPSQSEVRNQSLMIFPGYRSDVLLKAPDVASVYYLVDIKQDTATGPRLDTGSDGSPELLRWIAKIVVQGDPLEMDLPSPVSVAVHRLEDIGGSKVDDTQYAFYGLDLTLSQIGYFITRKNLSVTLDPVSPANAREYDPNNPRNLDVGHTARWFIGSRNNGAPVAHPFHIHVNPFLITKVTSLVESGSVGVPVDVTAREIGEPLWRDTLMMKHGYTYELLTRYEDFAGDFVNHCHILDHEDNGMMEKVSIRDTTPAPLALQPMSDKATPAKAKILGKLPGPNGTPSVLFFVQGSFCPHCLQQVTEMAKSLPKSRCRICVVSASTEEDLKDFPDLPYSLVADPKGKLFKRFKLGSKTHGTIVLNGAGQEVFRRVGDEPFMDSAEVTQALDESSLHVEIQVRDTSEVSDDYITWAPTPCTVRIVGGDPSLPDVVVTLSNDDPSNIPLGGNLAFASTLNSGETATSPTLVLELPQDGTPIPFFIAGTTASTLTNNSLLNGGRDGVLEVHRGGPGGDLLGEHRVMVRVRKNVATLNELEMNEFLRAVNYLHRTADRYEWYVELHRVASGLDDPWPDLAHKGSGFITWHRAFLLQFERELQTRFPHVALPYWVQGDDQPTAPTKKLFSPERLGSNTPGGDQVVTFDPMNPLYGWEIDLLHKSSVATGRMGRLRREALDHNLLPTTNYRRWDYFESQDSFFSFRDVEGDPHNRGHIFIGPFRVWMENCSESNADPVFWIFHCNHDYLWAKWQWHHNRFETDGSNPEHFFPNDKFTDVTANQFIPFGHHLGDTMWPWDGTSGEVHPHPSSTGLRPPAQFNFGDFPPAPWQNLWPQSAAHPMVADMIDYLGMSDDRLEFGVCYDDVPYGHNTTTAPPPLSLAKDQETRSLETMLSLLDSEEASSEAKSFAIEQIYSTELSDEDSVRLQKIVMSPAQASDLRAEVLAKLAQSDSAKAIESATQILQTSKEDTSLRITALIQLGGMTHFSSLSHQEMREIDAAMERTMDGKHPASLEAVALQQLAPTGNKTAEKRILTMLQQPSNASLSVPELLSLLRFYPNHRANIRQRLDSPQDEIVIAAIGALYQDNESLKKRIHLATDSAKASPVRRVAIQSLMYDDSNDSGNALLKVLTDKSQPISLREEAAASLRVFVQREGDNLNNKLRSRIQNQARDAAIDKSGESRLSKLNRMLLSEL